MATLFGNIGYLLIVLFLVVAVVCVNAGTSEGYSRAIVLSFITLTAWIPDLWTNPKEMAVVHLAILTCALLVVWGKDSFILLSLIFAMIVADCVAVVYSLGSNFYWQSILNLLFIIMCANTLKFCYNSQNNSGSVSSDRSGRFYARVSGGK